MILHKHKISAEVVKIINRVASIKVNGANQRKGPYFTPLRFKRTLDPCFLPYLRLSSHLQAFGSACSFEYDFLYPFYRQKWIAVSAILTDNGREFCGKDTHPYQIYLNLNDITHRTTRFIYDALGNRSKMNTSSGTSSYSYDANSGRLLTSANTPSGNFTFSYDDNGNLKTRVDPSNTATYTYDTLNHLTGIVQGGSTVATYSYNGAGQRVGKVAGGVTSSYLWDGSNLAQENRGGASYLYSYLGANPVAMTNLTGASSSQVFETDLLGSVLGAVNASGTELVQYDPDDFGNSQGQYGASANPFGFGGAFYDSESGLYQMRGRYYDPSLGRFLTVDINPGNPYSYCGNNPVSRADPSGWMFMYRASVTGGGGDFCKIVYAMTPYGVSAVSSLFPSGEFIEFSGWNELLSDELGFSSFGYSLDHMSCFLPEDEGIVMKAHQTIGKTWGWNHRRFGYEHNADLLAFEAFENRLLAYANSNYDRGLKFFRAACGAVSSIGAIIGLVVPWPLGIRISLALWGVAIVCLNFQDVFSDSLPGAPYIEIYYY